jgi:hypothetical protein
VTIRGVAVASLLVLALAGCSGGGDDQAEAASDTSATSAATSPSPTSTKPNDPAGQRACDAINTVNAMQADPAAMVAAGEAGIASPVRSIAINSALLRDYARLLVETVKDGNEMDIARRRVLVGNQVTELLKACVAGGYLSLGARG